MVAIEAVDLVKRFGSIAAVDGVSFQVLSGEFFAFLGPNGAGKTTTIHILCTLLRPTSGRVLVCGHDCATESHEVRRSIGLVFQETTLDRDLTAHENLLFSSYLHGMKKRVAEERITELLDLFGLADRKNALARQLSGGMRRMLDIARGILHRPKILFLDEPTTGLDAQARIRIWEFLAALRQREGMTIFLTTHYIEEAEGCDRVAIMDHGKIVKLDKPQELKRLIKGEATVNRPSLNDVFLQLTGREIR